MAKIILEKCLITLHHKFHNLRPVNKVNNALRNLTKRKSSRGPDVKLPSLKRRGIEMEAIQLVVRGCRKVQPLSRLLKSCQCLIVNMKVSGLQFPLEEDPAKL